LCNFIIPPNIVQAQTVLNLPVPGSMVGLSAAFQPIVIKGLTINPDNPLRFDFIIDQGEKDIDTDTFKVESNKLVRYFLATLTTPEEDLWVNLSPYEKDRIIPESFGSTEMGRDLLAQDYILKQLTSSLMYPEDKTGEAFWERVYKKAQEKFGTTDIPVNTFNKIWIVPDNAEVYEHGNSAFIVESHLGVMHEEDYLALKENIGNKKLGLDKSTGDQIQDASAVSTAVIKEVLIPEIEKEVNEGKNFTQLRQIYNSMILATWFKMNLKESFLGQVYIDKKKTGGIENEDEKINEKIYQQYLEAFKKGVYDVMKEEYDPTTQTVIEKEYFSGGFSPKGRDGAMLSGIIKGNLGERKNTAGIQRSRVLAQVISPPGFGSGTIRESRWRKVVIDLLSATSPTQEAVRGFATSLGLPTRENMNLLRFNQEYDASPGLTGFGGMRFPMNEQEVRSRILRSEIVYNTDGELELSGITETELDNQIRAARQVILASFRALEGYGPNFFKLAGEKGRSPRPNLREAENDIMSGYLSLSRRGELVPMVNNVESYQRALTEGRKSSAKAFLAEYMGEYGLFIFEGQGQTMLQLNYREVLLRIIDGTLAYDPVSKRLEIEGRSQAGLYRILIKRSQNADEFAKMNPDPDAAIAVYFRGKAVEEQPGVKLIISNTQAEEGIKKGFLIPGLEKGIVELIATTPDEYKKVLASSKYEPTPQMVRGKFTVIQVRDAAMLGNKTKFAKVSTLWLNALIARLNKPLLPQARLQQIFREANSYLKLGYDLEKAGIALTDDNLFALDFPRSREDRWTVLEEVAINEGGGESMVDAASVPSFQREEQIKQLITRVVQRKGIYVEEQRIDQAVKNINTELGQSRKLRPLVRAVEKKIAVDLLGQGEESYDFRLTLFEIRNYLAKYSFSGDRPSEVRTPTELAEGQEIEIDIKHNMNIILSDMDKKIITQVRKINHNIEEYFGGFFDKADSVERQSSKGAKVQVSIKDGSVKIINLTSNPVQVLVDQAMLSVVMAREARRIVAEELIDNPVESGPNDRLIPATIRQWEFSKQHRVILSGNAIQLIEGEVDQVRTSFPMNISAEDREFFRVASNWQEVKPRYLSLLDTYINELEGKDNMMASQSKKPDEVGGINLNPALLDMIIKRDGNGVPLPLTPVEIQNLSVDGFLPVIISVTPITDLPLLLGVTEDDGKDIMASVKLERRLKAIKVTSIMETESQLILL
ncbi:MAG: hypothetical protein HQL27_04715, partial [Candidatus Omnitrophica bacterium]|nr:hypothetical protein [Candidatus Omnitrophota bacterium]